MTIQLSGDIYVVVSRGYSNHNSIPNIFIRECVIENHFEFSRTYFKKYFLRCEQSLRRTVTF